MNIRFFVCALAMSVALCTFAFGQNAGKNKNPPVLENGTIEEIVAFLPKVIDSNVTYYDWKMAVSKAYLKELRKYMYENGRSFISKGGESPMYSHMKALADALNAKRLAGLDWCFEEIGRGDVKVDFSEMPSEEEVSVLSKGVLDGEVDFENVKVQKKLSFGLGVKGYNDLVKQYNGD